jgi:hypothetical protein
MVAERMDAVVVRRADRSNPRASRLTGSALLACSGFEVGRQIYRS